MGAFARIGRAASTLPTALFRASRFQDDPADQPAGAADNDEERMLPGGTDMKQMNSAPKAGSILFFCYIRHKFLSFALCLFVLTLLLSAIFLFPSWNESGVQPPTKPSKSGAPYSLRDSDADLGRYLRRLAPTVPRIMDVKPDEGEPDHNGTTPTSLRHKLVDAALKGILWNRTAFNNALGRFFWQPFVGREMLTKVVRNDNNDDRIGSSSEIDSRADSSEITNNHGLRCFTHTSDRAIRQYHLHTQLRSCYVSTLCYDAVRDIFTIPLRDKTGRQEWEADRAALLAANFSVVYPASPNDGNSIAIMHVLHMNVHLIDQPPPFPFGDKDDVETVVFDQRFHPDNTHHGLFNYMARAEAVMAVTEQWFDGSAKARSSFRANALPVARLFNIGFYSPRQPTLYLDKVLRPLLSAEHPFVNLNTAKNRAYYELWGSPDSAQLRPSLSERSFCTRNSWLGVPITVHRDGRYPYRYPATTSPPALARMIWARQVVAKLALAAFADGVGDILGGGPVQVVDEKAYFDSEKRMADEDELRNPDCISYACRLFSGSLRLAELERAMLWPAITPRWPNGTVIVLVEREGVSRVIANAANLYARLHNEFTLDRGYVVVFVKMETLTVTQQILLASRATVMVGSHGAGLAHSMWMQPGGGASLVELRSTPNRRKHFAITTQDQMIDYYVNQAPEPDWELDEGIDYDALRKYCANEANSKTDRCTDMPPGGWQFFAEDSHVSAPFNVNVDAVLSMVRYAVHRSDQRFGTPQGCHRPVTTQEARNASLWLYGR